MAFTIPARGLRILSLLLALAWMAGIYWISSQPGIQSDLDIPGLDKIFHAGAYGLLAGLWLLALSPGERGYSGLQLGLAAGIASLYGITDEWHQRFVPGRMADGWDLVADATGALLAVLILQFWCRRRLTGSTGTATNPASHPRTPGSAG